jgi:hypothetical protein
MRGALKVGGRCAIFTTNRPHGLVDLAARCSEIPPEVEGPLRFGPTVLRSYFEKNFVRYDVHNFHNVVTVPSTDILIEFTGRRPITMPPRKKRFAPSSTTK